MTGASEGDEVDVEEQVESSVRERSYRIRVAMAGTQEAAAERKI